MTLVFVASLFLFIGCFICTDALNLFPGDFTVNCMETGFQVTLREHKASMLVFSFIDQSCYSVDNGTHLVATTQYNECGTIKREFNDGTEYTNELLDVNYLTAACPHLNLKITCFQLIRHHRHRRSIEGKIEISTGCKNSFAFDAPAKAQQRFITCPFLIGIGESLKPDRVLTSTNVGYPIQVMGSKQALCKPLKNRGSFSLSMKLFTDSQFAKNFHSKVNEEVKASSADWYENVHYEVSTSQQFEEKENLHLLLYNCHATPDANPNNNLTYVYISNGCPVDQTVQYYTSPPGTARFSITSFQFQNSESKSFYSHCEVIVCDKKDPSARCQRKCNQDKNAIALFRKRKRRNTKKIDNIIKAGDVKVTCEADRMFINIKSINENTFFLNDDTDPKCVGKNKDGYITISAGYNECGTKLTIKGQHLYYTNEIIEKAAPHLTIIRGPLLKQMVRCTYKKKSLSSAVKIKLYRPPLRSTSSGSYKIQIDMYEDEMFTTKNSNSIIEVDENNDMFFEVKIANEPFKGKLELHLDTCLGYNEPIDGQARQTYKFIQDGCPRDKTVNFYQSKDAGKVRFSVKPFKLGSDSSILINCFVSACSVQDPNSKCKRIRNQQDELCKYSKRYL